MLALIRAVLIRVFRGPFNWATDSSLEDTFLKNLSNCRGYSKLLRSVLYTQLTELLYIFS